MRPCPRCGEVVPRTRETCPSCGYREPQEAPHVQERPVAGEEQRRLEEENLREVPRREKVAIELLLSVVPLVIPAAAGWIGYELQGIPGLAAGVLGGLLVAAVLRRFT